jgi:hypothetical protein
VRAVSAERVSPATPLFSVTAAQISARLQHMAEGLEAAPPREKETSAAYEDSGKPVSFPLHLVSWRL